MAEFYKMEIGRWNEGTDDLTLEQEAAYLRIVNAIRLTELPVRYNFFVLGGLWRCNERKAKRLLQELINAGKISIEGNSIVNRRAVDDASNLSRTRVERRSAGSRGGIESGKSRRKALENNKPKESLLQPDETREEKRRDIRGGGSACAREDDPPQKPTEREVILSAIGADPVSGMIGPNGRQIGNAADLMEARRWRNDLGLTLSEVVEVIREVIASKRDGPPSTFSYFTQAMQRRAAAKNRPPLTPAEGAPDDHRRDHDRQAGAFRPSTPSGRALQDLAAAFERSIPDEP